MPLALKKMHDREDGFTLIELLIVVLIIGILAAIAIPVYLGIQQQGYKSALKADVNISVKRVQVAITEGKTIADIKATPANYTQKSVKGENVYIAASSTSGASADDFGLSGVLNTGTNPAGPVNFSYTYDSVTGKFTESDSGLAFGSANPSIVITTSSLPDATVGTAYTATVSANAVSPTATTQYTATGLPTGWSINPTTGVISAANPSTPTTLTITVTATNGSVNATRAFTINVNDKARISTTTLPAGRKGQAYDQTLAFSGNPNPTFAVTSGALPAGVTLDTATARISGTPTAAGQANFTVTATNTGGSDAKAYSIAVNDPATIATTSLPDAKVGTAYNQSVSTAGYPAPTYGATSLPAGLSMNSSTGAITGTSSALSGNSYNVTVTADNGIGSPATKSLTLVNNEAPSVYSVNAKSNVRGGGYNDKLFNAGYTVGGTTFTTDNNQPTGISINSSGNMVGAAAASVGYGEYFFTVNASNSAGTMSQGYNITILDGVYTPANQAAYNALQYASYNGNTLSAQACGYWNNAADGCYQWSAAGVWFRSPAGHGGGYFYVYNVTRRVWALAGGYENGPYGWPTGAPVFNANGTVTQQFEKASITTSSLGIG